MATASEGSFIADSDDSDSEHHPAVLVLEVVAMEHVDLIAGEVSGARQRKINGDAHGLTRPDEHGVFATQIASEPSAVVDLQRSDLVGARLPFEHVEVETVQMH